MGWPVLLLEVRLPKMAQLPPDYIFFTFIRGILSSQSNILETNLYSKMNNGWKSSPLIDENPVLRRSSKRSSIHRDSAEYQHHKVPNPFIANNTNMVPDGLMKEISNLEYLTPHQLDKIEWGPAVDEPRRSSVFSRQIEFMQRAAREQEQKMGTPKRGKVCFQDETKECIQDEMEEEEASVSINERLDEDVQSRESRHRWALEPIEMEDEGFFGGDSGYNRDQSVHFYSMTSLPQDNLDWDDYFEQ